MREALTTNRRAEYFSEVGLRTLTNTDPERWDFVIFKELLDNALDAINDGGKKHIAITHDRTGLLILDSGTGIPEDELDRIFNFNIYLSSKRDFRTPTRGYQGNALKTVIGICFQRNMPLSFYSNGKRILYELDRTKISAGIVEFTKTIEEAGACGAGINVVHYQADFDIDKALWTYRIANPDVTFSYNGKEFSAVSEPVKRSDKTFIEWYDLEAFNQLLQAICYKDPERTVKQFCLLFSGTQRVLSQLDFPYKKLSEFASDRKAITTLHHQLCALSAKPNPNILKKLITGEKALLKIYGEHGEHKYKVISGEYQYQEAKIPFIIESFLLSQQDTNGKNQVICSVNNSIPYEECPFYFRNSNYIEFCRKTYVVDSIPSLLNQAGFHKARGLTLFINFISPFVKFTDKAKTRIISDSFKNELLKNLATIMKDTLKEIARAERANRAFNRRSIFHYREESKAELTERHFMESYNHASGNGQYLCTARQVFYALRQILIHKHGRQLEQHDYRKFTQDTLTVMFERYPELEDKILFEQRGSFYSPFLDHSLPLSTKDVQGYLNRGYNNEIYRTMSTVYDVSPELEFQHVLFVEKAGFHEIMRQAGLVKNLNIGLMSTQGFGTRSAKRLIKFFIEKGIKVYVLHDCDVAGYLIAGKFSDGSKTFQRKLAVVDIGLTVADIERLNKNEGVEVVRYRTSYDNVLQTLPDRERQFFGGDLGEKEYRRLELNALSTPEFLQFVESKIKCEPLKPSIEQLKNFINIDPKQVVKEALFKVHGRNIDISPDINALAQRIHNNINGAEHWMDTLRRELDAATRAETDKLISMLKNAG